MVRGSCDRNFSYGERLQRTVYASPPIISISIAFAAGAILAMLRESIIPEAFSKESFGNGLALLAGFEVALILTKVQGS
jgi:zinc transporter ZupT